MSDIGISGSRLTLLSHTERAPRGKLNPQLMIDNHPCYLYTIRAGRARIIQNSLALTLGIIEVCSARSSTI